MQSLRIDTKLMAQNQSFRILLFKESLSDSIYAMGAKKNSRFNVLHKSRDLKLPS